MSFSSREKKRALEDIAEQVRLCSICQKNTVGLSVPGEGSVDARVVFVGEAPGKQEAKSGRPFVGPAGRVLRGLIHDIGLNEGKFLSPAFSNIFPSTSRQLLPKPNMDASIC